VRSLLAIAAKKSETAVHWRLDTTFMRAGCHALRIRCMAIMGSQDEAGRLLLSTLACLQQALRCALHFMHINAAYCLRCD
jgi:hypothetical protein